MNENEERKVDGPIALLLQQFKDVTVTRFQVTLPSGRSAEKELEKPVKLDQLGALFYRRGAELNIKNGLLTWKMEGNEFTPILSNNLKEKENSIKKVPKMKM